MTVRYRDLFGGANDVIEISDGTKTFDQSTPEQKELLRKALRHVFSRWCEFIGGETNGYLSPDLTDGMAAWHFVRAKHFGCEYPRSMSVAFTPEQIGTPGDVVNSITGGSMLGLLIGCVEGDVDALDSIIWALERNISMSNYFTKMLAVHGHRLPFDFPATTARDIYDEFCPDDGSVLDPCHGWGGRLVGFLLSDKPSFYLGVDPSEHVHNGLHRLFETLAPYAREGKKAKFMLSPFESAKISNQFDMAFTSPPYFDVESYYGDLQSFRLYPQFNVWADKFYRQLYVKTYVRLKPGAHFLINVGNQRYPLVELGKKFAAEVGFSHIKTIAHIVQKNKQQNTSDERGESLIVFRRD